MRNIVLFLAVLYDNFACDAVSVPVQALQRNLSEAETLSVAPWRIDGNRVPQAPDAKSEDNEERVLEGYLESLFKPLRAEIAEGQRLKNTPVDLAQGSTSEPDSLRHIQQYLHNWVNNAERLLKKIPTGSKDLEHTLLPIQDTSATEKGMTSVSTSPNRRAPALGKMWLPVKDQFPSQQNDLKIVEFGHAVKLGVTPFSWKAMIDGQISKVHNSMMNGMTSFPWNIMADARSSRKHIESVDRYYAKIKEDPSYTNLPNTWKPLFVDLSSDLPRYHPTSRIVELKRLESFTSMYVQLVKDHRLDPLSLLSSFEKMMEPMTSHDIELYFYSRAIATKSFQSSNLKKIDKLANGISPLDYAIVMTDLWFHTGEEPRNTQKVLTLKTRITNPNKHIGLNCLANEKWRKQFAEFCDLYVAKLEELQQDLRESIEALSSNRGPVHSMVP